MLVANDVSVNDSPSTYLQIFDDDPAPDSALHRSVLEAPTAPSVCTEASYYTESVCTEAYRRPGREEQNHPLTESPQSASVQSPGLNASVQTEGASPLKYASVQLVDGETKNDPRSQKRFRFETSKGVILVNEGALDRTLPRTKGNRNAALWGLTRALTKWFFPTAGKKTPATELVELVIEWHRRGLNAGVIGTHDPLESVHDFNSMWARCEVPYDEGFVNALIDGAIAENADAKPIDKIRAICKALSANSLEPDGTLYLPGRLAAEKIGVSDRQAAYLIKKLVKEQELIVIVENTTFRGTRYRLGVEL